jgi:hypothetical protein
MPSNHPPERRGIATGPSFASIVHADTSPERRRSEEVVIRLSHDDVLLGRGAPIINYEGTIRAIIGCC